MRSGNLLAAWALAVASALAQPQPGFDPLARLDALTRGKVKAALAARDETTALRLVTAYAEAHPDAELYRWLGNAFFSQNQHLNAGIAFSKADKLSPLNERDRFLLAMCEVALSRKPQARRQLTRLAAAAPENANYVYWLARIDYDEQKFDSARQGFEHALKLDPKNARAKDNLGLALEALGRNEESLAAFRGAMELNRGAAGCSPWPGHNLGALLRKLGHLDQAEPPLRESLACDANFARSKYQLGLVLEKDNRLKDAEVLIRGAIAADPDYPEPHYALARILRNTGRKSDAAAELQTFQQLKSKHRAGKLLEP